MRYVFALLALGLALAACGPTDEPPDEVPPAEGFDYGPEVTCEDPYTGFDRLTEEASARGLTVPMDDPEEIYGFELQGRGGGLLVTDLDGDGDQDLVATRMDKAPSLMINDGTAHFTLLEPELPIPLSFSSSPALVNAAVDITGDSLPELFAAGGGYVSMWPNLGDLQFGTPVDIYNGLSQGTVEVILSLAFGDVDGDDDLDMVLACVGMGDGIASLAAARSQ